MTELGPEPPEWGDAREQTAAVWMLHRIEAELLDLDPTVELLLARLLDDLRVRRTARDSLAAAVSVRGEDGEDQRETFAAADQDVRRALAELHAAMHPERDDDPTSDDPEGLR